MNCRERLERYLRENGAAFEVREHAQAFTAQRIAASEHVTGWMVAKVVMVVADGRLRMLVLPAPEKVDWRKARDVLGAKGVQLASETTFAGSFPDCEEGAMPPFGNLYGVPVYVDETLSRNERFIFQAGTHTATISMRYADFARLVRPMTADLSMEPVAP